MDIFDQIAAGVRGVRRPLELHALAPFHSAKALELGYDLAKKVHDMVQRGFTIQTAYGEIVIEPGPMADAIAATVRRDLQAQAHGGDA